MTYGSVDGIGELKELFVLQMDGAKEVGRLGQAIAGNSPKQGFG